MNKFKVGDKVRFIGDHSGIELTRDKIYEVVSVENVEEGWVRVVTDGGYINGWKPMCFERATSPYLELFL